MLTGTRPPSRILPRPTAPGGERASPYSSGPPPKSSVFRQDVGRGMYAKVPEATAKPSQLYLPQPFAPPELDDALDMALAAGDFQPDSMGQGLEEFMTGVVKTWKEEKGWGFITPDGGTDDVFVHRSVLSDGESLVVGCPVMFDLKYDTHRKGFSATKCIGAVERPLTMEEAEAMVMGEPLPKGKGKGKKGKEAMLNSCIEDPWVDLYTDACAHLRAHLEPLSADPRKSAAKKTPAKATPKKRVSSGDNDITGSKAKETQVEEKVETKGTSIYDFFEEAEDSMLM